MKTVLFWCISVIFPVLLFGQGRFEYSWLDADWSQRAQGAIELSNGNYVISNVRYDATWDEYSVFLTLLDPEGLMVKKLEVSQDTFNLSDACIFSVSDSSFWVVGLSENKLSQSKSIWLGEYLNDFSLISIRKYGEQIADYKHLVAHLETDTSLLVSGWAGNNHLPFAGRIFFNKDTSFIHLNSELLGTSNVLGCSDITLRKDSLGYVLLGYFDYYLTNGKFEVTQVVDKTNTGQLPYPRANGAFLSFSDSSYLVSASVNYQLTWPASPDTSAILIGEVRSSNMELLRYNFLGTEYVPIGDEIKSYPASAFSIVRSVQSKDIFAGGTKDLIVFPPINHASKFVLGKFDKNLNKLWEKEYGDSSTYYLMYGLLVTSDGGCLMYGLRKQYTQGLYRELYVLKVNADGILTGETIIPLKDEICCYPNPAKDYIQFDLPKGTDLANLELIDLSGRVVLAQKINHQAPIDISFLPQGMYMYQVKNKMGALMGVGKVLKE